MYLQKKSRIAVSLVLLLALVVTSVLYIFAGDGITGATITTLEDTTFIDLQEISIRNAPIISEVTLNTTNVSANNTGTNLTAYANISGAGPLFNKTIYNNWFLNGKDRLIMVNLPFERVNNSATNNARDYSGYGNNGTINSGAVGDITWNSTGGIDGKGAYMFGPPPGGYIEIGESGAEPPKSSLNPSRVMTIAVWLKPRTIHNGTIIDKKTVGNIDGYLLEIVDNQPKMTIGTVTATSTYTLPNEVYSHVAGVSNGSSILIYVNGTLNGSVTLAVGITITANRSVNLRIGINQSGTGNFNGSIDEVTIWNRSLSAEQIWALYQNQSNVLVAQELLRGENWSVQATPNNGTDDGAAVMSNNVTIRAVPLVNITSPTKGSNFSTGTQRFKAAVIPTASTISTVLFMFNTNTTPFNVTASESTDAVDVNMNIWNATVNMSSLVELKNHTVTVYANDTGGRINQTERINFTVDRTPPNISSLTPSNGSNFSTNLPLQHFNATVLDNLTSVDTVIFQFSNGTTPFNKTATNVSGTWRASSDAVNVGINISSLVEGLQGVRIIANDTLNNANNSFVINFTVDNTAPVVTISSPNAGGTVSDVQNFKASVTDNLTAVNIVIFQFRNGSDAVSFFNRTASNTSGIWNVSVNTTIMPEGEQTFRVFANDTVGNINIPLATNNALRTIIVDNVAAAATDATGATATGSTATGATAAGSTATGATAAGSTATGATAAGSTATGATAAGSTATAAEAATAIQSGQVGVSVAPSSAGSTSEGGRTATALGIGVAEIVIKNNLDKKLVLSAALEEKGKGLENEENAIKRIKEELLLKGEIDQAALEKELSILKLLENVEVLQVYKTKLSHLLPESLIGAAIAPSLRPTGNRIAANLLKDSLLNADELQNIEVNSGETVKKEIKIRRGLRLDRTESPKIVFSSGGEQILIKDIEDHGEIVTGTAVDVDPETKKFDFYIIIPQQQGRGKETFTVEMDINVKKTKVASSPLPLKIKLPFFLDEASKSIFSELYGPYNVNLERGALLAVQYDASAIQGDYEVVGKIFNKQSKLVAENRFEIKQ